MAEPEVRTAPTDRATLCPICLSYAQMGYRIPPVLVQTAGQQPGACAGSRHNPGCPGHVPVPAT